MHMVEKILNNTTPYGKIRVSHEGSLHSSTLSCVKIRELRLLHENLSKILCKSCKCFLLQFYLMYNAIILYLESLVGIIAQFGKW